MADSAFSLHPAQLATLFLVATMCSLAATIATNMTKSQETTTQLMQAQTGDAKLEGLETLLELGKVDLGETSAQDAKALTDMPFI